MSSKSHEMDLCSGSLWKKIFVYSVPLMFTNILQVLFNMSDVAVVGKFAGAIALGAVGCQRCKRTNCTSHWIKG